MRDRRRGCSIIVEKGNGDDQGGGVVEEESCMGAVEKGTKREMWRGCVWGIHAVMKAGTKECGGGSGDVGGRCICNDKEFASNVL